MNIQLTPIAIVHNSRIEVEDDNWGDVVSILELDPSMPEDALAGIEDFSHAEIFYYFHLVSDSKIEMGARHPRAVPFSVAAELPHGYSVVVRGGERWLARHGRG